MKLRIKETGEILEDVKYIDTSLHKFTIQYLDNGVLREHTVKNLSDVEEIKDYGEPKEYWFLSGRGEVKCIEDENTVFDKDHKSIGNYFETKEEAEKTVEKLKAWKRLKNKGFRFKDWEVKNGHKIFFGLDDKSFNAGWLDENIVKDLDLLFGGEE